MKKCKLMFCMIVAIMMMCAPAFAGGFSFYTNGSVDMQAFTSVMGHSPTLYQMQSQGQNTELGFVARSGNYIPVAMINSNQNSYMEQKSSHRGGVFTQTDSGSSYDVGVGGGMGINSSTYSDSSVSTWRNSWGNASSNAGQTVTVGGPF